MLLVKLQFWLMSDPPLQGMHEHQLSHVQHADQVFAAFEA